ncbi:MAG TPA: uracil-DNA glycosylase [Accumulibacter sp.]|nr:uracil-DNA glycosylase [Accumulibacter sp.]HMW17951.1 uracil-DNA glycosylase [Accumulibacter sp.]HMX23282.1 uracil-DNA glycosylase [Accumulibacter sp.]HMY05517.1 uracil-DNA glycosylase [Accumulibacter sp.]HNC18896.1 uracil-DNA glycosylase [Accumulibacter sp.]
MRDQPGAPNRLPRHELLDEMGLSPQWRLRKASRCDRDLAPSVAPQTPSASESLLSPAPLNATGDDSNEKRRIERIASMDWLELTEDTARCQACGLCQQRRQAVLGVGDTSADWLFIGEGPGAEEDARGEPFVGQAGKLLDAMLQAIGLRRGEDVYIANAVKCRPPRNRTPENAEIAACHPYLLRQIVLLQPRLIILLGRVAAQALLGEVDTLASLRGRTFSHRTSTGEIPMLVSYHPAYLLRNLTDKAKAWQDLCRARELMRQAKNTP